MNPCAQKAFILMRWNGILLIIQETKNVEPGSPVQHFLLQLHYITDGVSRCSQCVCINEIQLKIFFFLIEATIIEKVHILKLLIFHLKILLFFTFAAFTFF